MSYNKCQCQKSKQMDPYRHLYYPPARGRAMTFSPPYQLPEPHFQDYADIPPPPAPPHVRGGMFQARGRGYGPPVRGRGKSYPVQNMGYMRQPKQPGTHVSDAPSRYTAMPQQFEIPTDEYTLEQPPDSYLPPPPPPIPIQSTGFQRVSSIPWIVPTTHESPVPFQPSVTPVNSMSSIPGMTMASCTRTTTEGEQAQKRIRRRDYNITYWGDDINSIVSRMAVEYKELVAYAIFQQEKCPSTERLHWQMYIEFFNPQDITFVKTRVFQDTGVHVEIRLRAREDARNYCRKERTRAEGRQEDVGPFELGVWRDQGNGQKMAQIREALADGLTPVDLAVEEPGIVLRQRVNLEWYHGQMQQRGAMNENRDVTVRLFIGKTGTGKTWLAQQEAMHYTKGDRSQVFILDSCGKQDAIWFDGYGYGPVLIVDDYDSWIQVAFLLRLLDKYPCRLPVKGSVKWAKYTEVWITSNKPIQEWTNNDGTLLAPAHQDALYRRLDWILWFPDQGQFSYVKRPTEIKPMVKPEWPTVVLVTTAPTVVPPVVPQYDVSLQRDDTPLHRNDDDGDIGGDTGSIV